jgi:hypothetical protein
MKEIVLIEYIKNIDKPHEYLEADTIYPAKTECFLRGFRI